MTAAIGWLGVVVVVLLVAVVVVAITRASDASSARQRQVDGPRQPAVETPPVHRVQVESLRDRLGHDIRTLAPGSDPVAEQALADASERFTACSVLLERADSQPELRTAWLAAVEGLTASRLVRVRLGLDPGPEIPLPPALP